MYVTAAIASRLVAALSNVVDVSKARPLGSKPDAECACECRSHALAKSPPIGIIFNRRDAWLGHVVTQLFDALRNLGLCQFGCSSRPVRGYPIE
jgi:hypothetical protein